MWHLCQHLILDHTISIKKRYLSKIFSDSLYSSVGWPKGVYIIKAKIGKEEITEKIVVK